MAFFITGVFYHTPRALSSTFSRIFQEEFTGILRDKLVFESVHLKKTLSLRASAQDFRGNPPVERNQVSITAKNRNVSPLCRAIVDTFPF